MERPEQIEEYLIKTRDYLDKAYLDNYKKIEKALKDNEKRLLEQLQKALQYGIDKAEQLQKAGKKGNIKYISLSLLLSSILTEEYSIGINFYDENFYLDEETVFTEVKIEFIRELIKEYVETDIKNLMIYYRQERINCPENELIELRKTQGIVYALLYSKWIIENIEKAALRLEVKEMQTEERIDFTYGMYLEKQEKIYQWEV